MVPNQEIDERSSKGIDWPKITVVQGWPRRSGNRSLDSLNVASEPPWKERQAFLRTLHSQPSCRT